ncbi:hypothetical protein [Xiashengella succiniciproducens]|jgi:hypothetical protein|uniref:Uncharacterized protein n=1 Tax=Xiashengella succiniciproducens TaxID=2949635 RepID=A0A9J6ZRZ9_9BACT|nr:hypothetical protein [Alkaliflexus sp. Ai-910]URW80626.1 hypothetical protein M9189_04585 [Alkaliflexus sp. Ai-910]
MKRIKGLIYLFLLLILLPICVYQLALKKTISQYWLLRQEKIELNNLQKQIRITPTANVEDYGDDILQNGHLINLMSQNMTLNNVKIERYTPILHNEEEFVKEFTVEIVFEGQFISLIKMINEIETKYSSCKIASANFKIQKQRQQNNEKLYLTLWIQQLNNIKK